MDVLLHKEGCACRTTIEPGRLPQGEEGAVAGIYAGRGALGNTHVENFPGPSLREADIVRIGFWICADPSGATEVKRTVRGFEYKIGICQSVNWLDDCRNAERPAWQRASLVQFNSDKWWCRGRRYWFRRRECGGR